MLKGSQIALVIVVTFAITAIAMLWLFAWGLQFQEIS
jgi:hypothetical protein